MASFYYSTGTSTTYSSTGYTYTIPYSFPQEREMADMNTVAVWCMGCSANVKMDIPTEEGAPHQNTGTMRAMNGLEFSRFLAELYKKDWYVDFPFYVTADTTREKFKCRCWCPNCKPNIRSTQRVY